MTARLSFSVNHIVYIVRYAFLTAVALHLGLLLRIRMIDTIYTHYLLAIVTSSVIFHSRASSLAVLCIPKYFVCSAIVRLCLCECIIVHHRFDFPGQYGGILPRYAYVNF